MDKSESKAKCSICSNDASNMQYVASEKMLGLGGNFIYVECTNCGTLELKDPPENIATFYPDNYYSYVVEGSINRGFKGKLQDVAIKALIDYRIGERSASGALLARTSGKFAWVRKGMFDRNTPILDVGCGAGELLSTLKRAGFKHLFGADPFIQESTIREKTIQIDKRTIDEIEGKYGFIMLNHTFEHLPDPKLDLIKLKSHLQEGGTLMLRIPIGDCWAWRNYGIDWVQLDAPRHFFLHTENGLRILANQCNLELVDVKYDSTRFQFVGSEKYKRGLTLDAEADFLSAEELDSFDAKAKALNAEKNGDCATFYFQHS